MAVSSSSNVLHFVLMSSLGSLFTSGSAFLMTADRTSSAPHFTECVSREQETFRCWWNPGSFHNLSSPGALTVFYLLMDPSNSTWKACPEYIHSRRECFFDSKHTSSWFRYCMQLRTQTNVTYFNDDDCFTVEDIVIPDPPVALNWTALNRSPSGYSYDIMVKWQPPPTADVATGWLRLEYEIQYREKNTTNWKALEVQPQTQQTVYGLHIGKEYEVHIRCSLRGRRKFGDFSDSIFIHVAELPSKGRSHQITDSTFPLTVAVIFGIVGILILIMVVVISQQHRLVMIFLPPVPAPKIKGIDPDLLKKGKLEELNFILSGGGMGGLPSYGPDFYQEEPWVEFIEMDAEDTDTREKETSQGSDTQRLLSLSQPARSHTNTGCSRVVRFPDNDSGHASCCDPELPDQDSQMLMTTMLPGQPEDRESSPDDLRRDPASEKGERSLVCTQTGVPQIWVNTDFYAQVSNVMLSGGVVLSSDQQLRIQLSIPAMQDETQKKGAESGAKEETDEMKEAKQKELQFQLLVVDPEGSGYTKESITQQNSTPTTSLIPGEGYQTIQPEPVETKPHQEDFLSPETTIDSPQSPYILPDSPQSQLPPPVADYTVIQEVDSQHSLLLNPTPGQSPPSCLPQQALKALSAMPVGYITPDLLGNLSP
ncbi:growth hormone receptor a isoform X2 [Thalassophryne amazonica]|uniref:growth hormone receptor a isoform X2 n=1 Tax=Thalassophryne amazonica TaxID=390379 RepID=UPI0014721888|nr:growth hormone receptor a isoform X2 [Thalassophryne amazonica]